MFTSLEIKQEVNQSTRSLVGKSNRRKPPENDPTFWDEPRLSQGKCPVDIFFIRRRKNLTGLLHENE